MNIKKIYAGLLIIAIKIIGIDNAKRLYTYLRFKRKLDLKSPRSLADKVCYLELHENGELHSRCTDKYEVRKYIEEKGLQEHLVSCVGGPWLNVSDIDFDELPPAFALKATHGCKMNYLVPDKQKVDIAKCKQEMERWLATTYGTYSLEPHYVSIPHRIYAEEYLGNMSKLIDYKFHCLNGEPKFILTVTDRAVNGDKAMEATLDLFDMDWQHIDAVVAANSEKPGLGNVPKPNKFEEMTEIARVLAQDFKFVRVDLYELDNKVYIGELTFSPACCVFPYFKESFLLEMGYKLILL